MAELYVSPTGDDAVTRANNDINSPWLTVGHAMITAEAGDVVNFRGGTYSITTNVVTVTLANHGTAGSPIIFQAYLSESVLWEGAGGWIYLDKNYWTIKNINATAIEKLFVVSDYQEGDNITFDGGTYTLQTFGGGNNHCVIFFTAGGINGGGKDCLVQNILFTGPGRVGNNNTAGIFMFRIQGVKVFNCEFTNFPSGIDYKHPCVGFDTGIEMAYNYFHNNERSVGTAMQYANIHNNLSTDGTLWLGGGGGAGDDGLNHGGDFNLVEHNTVIDFWMVELPVNEGIGGTNNTLHNNIFLSKSALLEFSSETHDTIMDWNLYPTGDILVNDRTNYTLAAWQSFYGQDANSLSDTPTFVGGGSPSSISGYALTAASPGYQGASDGKDMGADMSLVGIQGGAPANVDLTAPIATHTHSGLQPQLVVGVGYDVVAFLATHTHSGLQPQIETGFGYDVTAGIATHTHSGLQPQLQADFGYDVTAGIATHTHLGLQPSKTIESAGSKGARDSEERLALHYDYGASGTQTQRGNRIPRLTGNTINNRNEYSLRGRWNVGERKVLRAELDYLQAFYRARRGSMQRFRLKDWSDFTATWDGSDDLGVLGIGVGNGNITQFQLIKRYVSGVDFAGRTIVKPVPGSVAVYVDSVEQVSGWSVDTTTGLVTFSAAPSSGAVLRASFQFDVRVKFASPFSQTFKFYNVPDDNAVYDLPGIEVVEV